MYVLPSGKWKLKSYDIYFTAVPDNNDIEAIFTWRGHGRSFVGFLSGNVRLLAEYVAYSRQSIFRLSKLGIKRKKNPEM